MAAADGWSDACKKVGKSVNSELSTGLELSVVLMTGTGYICRVIYGGFMDVNVYFYASEDGCAVATYNGTTENPVESCVESIGSGAISSLEIDIEAAVYSSVVESLCRDGNSIEVTCCIRWCSEGVPISAVAAVDDYDEAAVVCCNLLSAAGSGEGENPSVLDAVVPALYIKEVSESG